MTKTRLIILSCALLLVAGFAYATGSVTHEKEVTSADAEALARLLAFEVRAAAPSAEISPASRGGAGNVHSMSIDIEVPATDFPPERIQGAMETAVKKWAQFGLYSISGSHGISYRHEPPDTACRAFLHFGSSRSHTFIDAVAYPFGEQTRIEILVRTLE